MMKRVAMVGKMFKIIALLSITVILFSFDRPVGWLLSGTSPQKYDMGILPGEGYNGRTCATIKSHAGVKIGIEFGTLMQNISPEKYAGKRLRMTGYLKTANVDKWAALWLRVDGNADIKTASFDNMFERRIKGTTGWQQYELVMDVPYYATNIAFGSLLTGSGQIWFDDIVFEVVGKDVPVTDRYPHDKSAIPVDAEEHAYKVKEAANLDFEQ